MTKVPEKVREAYRELPPGWKLEKLKFFADVRNSNVDKTISEDEEPVRLCNYTDVYYNDRITPDLDFMEGSATEAEIERFQLRRGQVIITKDSEGWDDIGIPALVTEDMPEVLCGYHLSVFEPGPELDGGFIAWLCRAEPLNGQFKLAANGVTRFGLGQYPMKNAFISLPPLDTQRQIVRFLDEKTARIDGLIEKKRALLDRLAEKRQALITRAVTKGLNPDAPMKPSGIDWIGNIPAHWELKRLKFGTARIGSGVTPRGGASVYVESGVMLLRSQNVHFEGLALDNIVFIDDVTDNEMSETRVFFGDVLLNITGASIGRCCLFDQVNARANVNQHVCIIRPIELVADFVEMLLASSVGQTQIDLSQNGASREGLNFGDLGNFIVPSPPVSEQGAIAQTVRVQVDAIGEQLLYVLQSICTLEEYRSALVTAAVTGQIKGLC